MKILCICEPASYQRPSADIPIFYQRLAADSRVASFHLPTSQVLQVPFAGERPQVTVAPLTDSLDYERFLQLDAIATQPHLLESFDLVFCRTLKPFPEGYLKRLQQWETTVKFVNRPSSKLEQIHPNFLLQVAQPYIPDTVVAETWQQALPFFERHRTIVAKRPNSCGGRGIFKIWYADGQFQVDNLQAGLQQFSDFAQVMHYVRTNSSLPIQLMRYLPQVRAGDKRVIVVDGEIYGAFIRRSKGGYWVNNISGDGECYAAEVGDLEREAIEYSVGQYRDRGLLTLGYDFLQDEDGNWRISEINAGNIGGFARLEALTGRPILQQLMDWLINFAQSARSR